MKANAPRRKVFQDAVDLFAASEEVMISESAVQEIPVEKIIPFHNHPFHLYEGERLNEMVESIKEHGILNPVIVQKKEDTYEMLAGHNRWNAAKVADVKKIPAIVKEGLTEQEAYVYVIETNMLQRSFAELTVSEKAAVLAERYDKVLSQEKRNDIIKELEVLQGKESTCGNDCHKLKNRDNLGEEYGLSGRTVANLLRVNHLIPELKEKVDAEELNFVAGVGLSYPSEEEQKLVLKNEIMPDEKQVKRLREDSGNLTEEKVAEVMSRKEKDEMISITIPEEWREKYFEEMNTEQIYSMLEEVLEFWINKV